MAHIVELLKGVIIGLLLGLLISFVFVREMNVFLKCNETSAHSVPKKFWTDRIFASNMLRFDQ